MTLDSDYDSADFLDSLGRVEAPEGVDQFLQRHLQQSPLTFVEEQPLRAELDAFLEAAQGHCEPAVTGAQGRRAMEAATQVIESLRGRGESLEKA